MKLPFHHKLAHYAKVIIPPLWYTALFVFLLWYSVSRFYPGIHSHATLMQLKEATEPAEIISGWRPPLLTLIWKIIASGQQRLIMAFNASLLWLGLVLSVTAIVRKILYSTLIILLLGFSSYYMPYLAYYHKDIPFGASLLLACGLLLQARQGGRYLLIFPAIFLIFFACSIRHNGFFAILPICVMIVYHLREKVLFLKKSTFIKGLLLFVIIFILSFTVNESFTRYQHKKNYIQYPTQALFLFDVAGTSVFANEMLLPQFYKESKNPGLNDINYLKEQYSPSTVLSLQLYKDMGGLGSKKMQMRALFNAWILAVTHYPTAYLKHRLQFYKYFLCFPTSTIKDNFIDLINSKYAQGEIQPYEYTVFRNYYETRLIFYNKPNFFMILYFLIIGWFVERKFRVDPVIIGMTFSGFLYLLGYLIVGLDIYSKYTWWCAISLPVITVYICTQYTSRIYNLLKRTWFGNADRSQI